MSASNSSTLELRAGVNVLHEVLDVERSDGVGRENLLQTLATGSETEGGLGAGEDVDPCTCP